MDALYLILVLTVLFASLLVVERWLGHSEVERHMRRMTRRVNRLNVTLGRRFLPAIIEATKAFEDLNRELAQLKT